jgi:hypothetical protein
MDAKTRAQSIIKDILVNHLPRVVEGLEKGYVDENQILVIYDHAVRARVLTEQPEVGNAPSWHHLSSLREGDQLTELLASTSEDGIGIIARWMRRDDGTWAVTAMDTEGKGGMKRVTDFHEGEPVPPTPPDVVFPA